MTKIDKFMMMLGRYEKYVWKMVASKTDLHWKFYEINEENHELWMVKDFEYFCIIR